MLVYKTLDTLGIAMVVCAQSLRFRFVKCVFIGEVFDLATAPIRHKIPGTSDLLLSEFPTSSSTDFRFGLSFRSYQDVAVQRYAGSDFIVPLPPSRIRSSSSFLLYKFLARLSLDPYHYQVSSTHVTLKYLKPSRNSEWDIGLIN